MRTLRKKQLDRFVLIFAGFGIALVLIIALMVKAAQSDAAPTPAKACKGDMKFDRHQDGALSLNCVVRNSDTLIFTGSSSGDGYRLKWTVTTDERSLRHSFPAVGIYKYSVTPSTSPKLTPSMAQDPAWSLNITAEPKGLDSSDLIMVLHVGNKEDGYRKVRVSG